MIRPQEIYIYIQLFTRHLRLNTSLTAMLNSVPVLPNLRQCQLPSSQCFDQKPSCCPRSPPPLTAHIQFISKGCGLRLGPSSLLDYYNSLASVFNALWSI